MSAWEIADGWQGLRERGGPVADDGSLFENLAAIASCLAVLVGIAALLMGWRIARRERDFTRLVERQRALTELLASFEAMQAFDVPMFDESNPSGLTSLRESKPSEFEMVRARYRANLYASGEALPIMRGLAFPHIPVPAPTGARREGNPEIDSDEVMASRGEMLDTLDRLRERIQGH